MNTEKKSFTRFLPAIGRILLGLPMTVFGANLFLNFIPQPKEGMPEAVVAFTKALMDSGYIMPMIGVTLAVTGLLLLINRFVPLALALLAPFLVNSFLFHAILARAGLPMIIVFCVLEVLLAWAYRGAFCPMLAAKVQTGK